MSILFLFAASKYTLWFKRFLVAKFISDKDYKKSMAYTIRLSHPMYPHDIYFEINIIRIGFRDSELLEFVKKLYTLHKHTNQEQVAFAIAVPSIPITPDYLKYNMVYFTTHHFFEIPPNYFENVSNVGITVKEEGLELLGDHLKGFREKGRRFEDCTGFLIHTHPANTLSPTDSETLRKFWSDRFSGIIDMTQKIVKWDYKTLLNVFKIFYIDAEYNIHPLKGVHSRDKVVFSLR
jgi:hypothetical protein